MLDWFTFDHFKKSSSLLHAVTTKSQTHPYRFSLALHTGEDTHAILENRNTLASLLGCGTPLTYIVANQTHSEHITCITEKKTRGWYGLEDAVENCDALITKEKGVVLTILTADCVPILLYDTKKEVVAAVHAGWRGTKRHLAAKTVQEMTKIYDCDPKDIIAGIAPAIGACCYEVGKDVAEHFFDTPKSLSPKGGKYMLDLPYLNKVQLLSAGLTEEHIQMSQLCTACHTNRFFSYRRENGCSGRFMSMIGMKA